MPEEPVVYKVDGTEFTVTFVRHDRVTFCAITWINKRGRVSGTFGASYCNPKDTYDQAAGDKIAIKRACGVGVNQFRRFDLSPLYSAWRKDQRESLMPKAEEHGLAAVL